MPDFEQLNFKVEAQDNATKTLNKILKTLTELEKKMNGLSKFKMPNIGLTNQQIKLLNNWDKLDKKLQKVEQDLKGIGKVQKQLQKFEIVSKGKPLFTYDSATQSYVDNNLGVARRQREKIQKQLEEQGIKDLVKGWGKGQLSLPYTGKKFILPAPNEIEVDLSNSEREKISQQYNERLLDIIESQQLYKSERLAKQDFQYVNDFIDDFNFGRKFFYGLDFRLFKGEFPNELQKPNEIIQEIDENLRELNNKKVKPKIVLEYPNYNEVREWHENLEKQRQGLYWSDLNINADLYKRRTTYGDDGSSQTTSIYKQQIKDLEYTYEVVDDKVKRITTQTKKATKEASKLKDRFKGVSKFLKSIGKIVLYRAIRSAMAEIKKAIQSSQEDLAKFDSSYNETLSKLVTSLDVLKASMGLIIRPFVEVIEPTIGNIVDLFAQVGNYISYATAKSKGLSTYTKINADYAKDYLESLQQANNLLSFDKFEVLQKQETKDIYEEASVADGIDASENIKDIGDFLINGSTTLNSVLDTLEIIVDLLAPLRLISVLTNLSDVVDGISKILESFTTDWDKDNITMGFAQIFKGGIANTLTNILEVIINLFINNWNKTLNMWNDVIGFIGNIFGKEWKLNWYLDEVDLGEWQIVDKPDIKMPDADGILDGSSSYASNKIFGNDTTTVANSIGQQLASKAVIEIDFKNTNNNAIARELAGSMADQFKKQNIKVSYT